jgi:magnesium-transporting ATPase (P-type)
VTPEVSQAFQEAYATIGGMGERVLGFAQAYLDPEQYGPDYPFKESKGAHCSASTPPSSLYPPISWLIIPAEEDGQSSFNFPTTKLCFIGLISLIDPPRPTVPHAVATCQRAGIRVIMVTGDHPLTAKVSPLLCLSPPRERR